MGTALRAAAGDIDGDGSVDLVHVDATNLRIVPSSNRKFPEIPADGVIQVLSVADLDGDGRADILAGWGATTQDVRGQACVDWFHVSGDTLSKETVALPSSKRPEIVAILPISPTSLLYAFYDEKYMVESDLATRETAPAWTSKYFAEIRMADTWARADVDGDGTPDVVVGQLYGESGSSNGGAFILREDHSRVPIPTTRGVRAIAIADTDGDGKNEIFLADGWHKDYAGKAQGLLSWSRWDGRAFHTEVIEETAQPSIQRILAADLDGDGRPEIVTLGPKLVRAFKRTAAGWRGLTISGKARDIAAASFDGKPGSQILIVASHSEIVDLRQVRWP